MSADTKKTKALELAITQIDRQFGKGSIMRLGGEYTQLQKILFHLAVYL